MVAYAKLSEEEMYLYCMMQDPSGIDLAEFTWVDHDQPDNCWRAWPFQWAWWRNPDQRQLDQCGRSLGKSTGIALRAFSWPFRSPGAQMAVIAPQLNHLRPLNTLIEQRLLGTRLAREIMRPGNKAVTHPGQALQAEFLNGATLLTRIPGADGKSAKGLHPKVLECDECFPAGTLVLTHRGQVPIEDVRIGDEVFTHRRRWRAVSATATRERSTVLLKGHGTAGLVASTHHPFRAAQRYAAQIIDPETSRLKPATVIGEPAWVSAEGLSGHNWATPTQYPKVNAAPSFRKPGTSGKTPCVQDSDDFFWMVGLYIAEGSYNASSGGRQVTFSIHDKEVPYVRKRLEALGLTVFESSQKDSLCTRLLVNSVVLGDWLEQHCGKGAHNKEIPVWVLGLRRRWRQALFDGLIYGDGYEIERTENSTEKCRLTTVSRKLAVSARLLAMTLGWWGNIHWSDTSERETFIRGRQVFGDGFYQMMATRDGKGFSLGSERFSQVREVIPTGRIETLYDLTVEEDASFLAEGFVVHNSQDLPEAVWNELIETVKREVEGSKWLVHGVTRGVHDRFFKFSQPGSGWTVHRFTGMSRPGWSEEERQAKMEEYGGYDTPDYKRNVLGLHGDQTSPLFTARSLFACVDDDETSDFNVNEYRRIDIYGESLGEGGESILYSLDHPANHLSGKYDQFWIGMDIGHTVAPSEILVFGEHKPKGRDGDSTLRVLLRIHMVRVGIVEQLEAMLWVIKSYGPKAFGMDATGAGLPYVQMIQNKLQENDDAELRKALEVIRGYNFSEKIVVDFDDTKDPDLGEDNEIKRNVGDFSFDTLRVLVDQKRIELPWDRELISEFQASSFTITGSATSVNEYGKRTYSSSKADHALDAARMAVLAYQQHKIEAMLRPQRRESVYLGFISN